MRISFDIRPLGRSHWTGIENYVFHLVAHLTKILPPADQLQRFAFTYGQRRKLRFLASHKLPDAPNVTNRVVPLPVQFLTHSISPYRLAGDLLLGIPDLVHVAQDPGLDFRRATLIATIFDLIPSQFPQQFPEAYRRKCDAYVAWVSSRAAKIVTISETVKDDIKKLLAIPDERIHVTPLAPDSRFHPLSNDHSARAVKKKYGITGPYLLYIGTLAERKNLASLLRAYSLLPLQQRQHISLVLCGHLTSYAERLRALAAELGVRNSVCLTGYVPFNDLHNLLCAAQIFVYPSLYEGFGLPVLEAMACGVPVVASNTSSIPEVAGDAAILVPPQDVDALAGAIREVLEDKNLRETLRHIGLERSKAFTWERTAHSTLGAYRAASD